MDDKSYYSRKGYVSNSIVDYLRYSAKKFKQALDGEIEQEDKPYLRFGQLVHLKVLEAWEFDKDVLVFDYQSPKSAQQKSFIEQLSAYPEELTDDVLIKCYKNNYVSKESDEVILKKASKLAKEYTNYLKYLLLKDIKTIISSKEQDKIKEMDYNCRSHKLAKDILFDPPHPIMPDGIETHNEFEILWKWENVKCKSLVDRHIVDHNKKEIHLIDFKTTAKIHDFEKSFHDFKYDRQMVFYSEALAYQYSDLITGGYKIRMSIVACDTITHEVRVFKIVLDDITVAYIEFKNLMTQADYHISNNKWDHSMAYYTGDGYEKL